MAMKRCPVCGERYSDTYKTCPFCEEEEYWEEEQQEPARRPILREGARSAPKGSRSPYSIVTPILIVLILLMAALLIYLLYGDKIAEKFSKDPDEGGKTGIQTPVDSGSAPDPDAGTEPGGTEPGGTEPDGDDPSGNTGTDTPDVPDDGTMPEGSGEPSASSGGGTGSSSGGMSYASAAALPSGLTLNIKDFTEPVSTGTVKLRVSGGTGTYTWISENPAVATVASDGTVTLVASGTTNVLVTDGTKKAVCIVRVTGGSSAKPSTTAPSTTTPSTNTAAPSSGGSLKTGSAKVVNGGNGVRVRSGPGTNYDILATVPNGGEVQVKADAGSGWYEITFVNVGGVTTTGYMKGDFLTNS